MPNAGSTELAAHQQKHLVSYFFFVSFAYFAVNLFLKPETHPKTPCRSGRSETVLVVLLIENILDRSVNTQGLLPLKGKCIPRRQIAFAVAGKAVDIGVERRVAKYRSEIGRRRQKIKIHPKSFEPLRRNERELMIGNAERCVNSAARNLWCALIAVSKCVGRKEICRTTGFSFHAELTAASDAAFLVLITAKRTRGRTDIRHNIAIADDVIQSCIKISRREPNAFFRQILLDTGVKGNGLFRS